jgi:hypothetical protein
MSSYRWQNARCAYCSGTCAERLWSLMSERAEASRGHVLQYAIVCTVSVCVHLEIDDRACRGQYLMSWAQCIRQARRSECLYSEVQAVRAMGLAEAGRLCQVLECCL